MIVFPHCKINLGLQILHKRSDGYHALQTVFYPLRLRDVLEIIRQPSTVAAAEEVVFSTSGILVPGNATENLCLQAYHLLKQHFPDLPAIQMHLHKNIPMGAGLGGGSSDGAFTLQLLNDQFQLGLSLEQLSSYALALGSDCPYFLYSQPCYATGRGEVLTPLSLSLRNYQIVLVNPGVHVNTGEAFRMLGRGSEAPEALPDLRSIVQSPPETWKETLINDFEAPVSSHYPVIHEIKSTLYAAGALYASMTGTGSTVFGIFRKEQQPVLSFPSHFFVYREPAA